MRRSATILLAVALALAGGCITPSIPIPPPDPTEMNFHLVTVDLTTTATFTYPSFNDYCGGVAYLYDRNCHCGIIHDVNPDCTMGPWTMQATLADQIDVSVQKQSQTVSTCIRLREGPQSPFDYCTP